MPFHPARSRTPTFYFYKANWSNDPFVYITDRRFTPRNAATGPVKVYSNCDTVELFIDGQSVGTRKADEIHRFIWENVTLKAGINQLRAVGKSAGATHEDSGTIVTDPAALDRVNAAP